MNGNRTIVMRVISLHHHHTGHVEVEFVDMSNLSTTFLLWLPAGEVDYEEGKEYVLSLSPGHSPV